MYDAIRLPNSALTLAREIAERIPSLHPALLKSEFELLLDVIRADTSCRGVLDSLVAQEREHVADLLAAFADGRPGPESIALAGLTAHRQRAALGLLLVTSLVGNRRWSTLEVGNRAADIGRLYLARGSTDTSDSQALATFVHVFVNPILNELAQARNGDDLIRTLLLRYKQRSEWFERDRLQRLARGDGEGGRWKQVEGRLKTDLHRYLFDCGIEFVTEPYTPSRSAKADLVSVVLPHGRRLVLEVKVLEPKSPSEIVHGIRQAKHYADEWGEPVGYCVVYNLTPGITLELVDAERDGEFNRMDFGSRLVNVLIVDLAGADASANPKAPAKARTVLIGANSREKGKRARGPAAGAPSPSSRPIP
jgi:hypothetical protein